MRLLFPLLLLFCPPAFADEPTSIEFPQFDPQPAPMPQPMPPPSVDAVPTVRFGEVFVISSDTPFFVEPGTDGLVTVTPQPGPQRVRGIFAGGSGQVEWRTYNRAHLVFVDVVKGASGRLKLIAFPEGISNSTQITRMMIDIGAGPQPPPDPIDPDPPTPKPGAFRAAIVRETSGNLTQEQLNILSSTQIVRYLNEHCEKDSDGRPAWRKWDPDIPIADNETQGMKDFWNAAKPKLLRDASGKVVPQMLVSKDGKGDIYPLDKTEAEVLKQLKMIGGE